MSNETHIFFWGVFDYSPTVLAALPFASELELVEILDGDRMRMRTKAPQPVETFDAFTHEVVAVPRDG